MLLVICSYRAIRADYNLTELNLPSRTSRAAYRSATPSKDVDRDRVEQRPRDGSGSFGGSGSFDRTDYSKTKAGANGGSTKEGRWEKGLAVAEDKNSNSNSNSKPSNTNSSTRPAGRENKAQGQDKAQDKKQTHMDQMKEFEEMRLKLRAEREDTSSSNSGNGDRGDGSGSGNGATPVKGGTFHNETDNLMAEMIRSSNQTQPQAKTQSQSQAPSGNGIALGGSMDVGIHMHKPLDNDVIGSLTGALMDSLFAPAPVSASGSGSGLGSSSVPPPVPVSVEGSSRLFSWSAAASTPTPPPPVPLPRA